MKKIILISAVIFCLHITAQAQYDPNLRDTLKIGYLLVPINPGRDTVVYLPVNFFVDDSLDIVLIPLTWNSPDGHIFPGNPVWRQPFTDWDALYDTVRVGENLMLLTAYRDISGPENLEYYPLGQWHDGVDLRIIIESDAWFQAFTIDTTQYDNGIYLMFFCRTGDGESEFKPVFIPGLLIYTFIDNITNEPALPINNSLSQNYPNPFNSQTVIGFELKEPSHAKLEIFDITGAKIVTLVAQEMAPGKHGVFWDADGYSSGIYYYRLVAGEYHQTEKMLLIK